MGGIVGDGKVGSGPERHDGPLVGLVVGGTPPQDRPSGKSHRRGSSPPISKCGRATETD